jgi:hypothetical protein
MKTFRFVPVLILLVIACGDDSPQAPPPVPDTYADLSNKTDVLHNLELAYNRRNITECDKILDSNFTFFLSSGDVNDHLPAQWDRAFEVAATENMFSITPIASFPLVKRVDMDVQYENGVQWVEVPNPPSAPAETWYRTTAFYNFQITVEPPDSPEVSYLPYPNAKAQFTVRNAGTDQSPLWQLVEWRDLGDDPPPAGPRAMSTEPTTWGRLKWLYGEAQ